MVILTIILVQVLCCHSITKITRNGINGAMFLTADLIKTNVMLNDFNGQPSEAQGVLNVELTVGRKTVPTSFFIVNSKSTYTVLLGGIGFTPIVVSPLRCTSVWFNGMATKWR